jgi:hypothetical protein
MKGEGNLAVWYSSVLLLFAGVVAFLNLGVVSGRKGTKWIPRVGWCSIGCLLLMLSGDEMGQVHESIATLVLLSRPPESRNQVQLGAGDWIPYLLPFIVASSLLLITFILYMTWRRKTLMVIGLLGVVCWIGSIVAESIEGRLIHVEMPVALEGMIEESLEIIGTTLLLVAFSEHFQWRQGLKAAQAAGARRLEMEQTSAVASGNNP